MKLKQSGNLEKLKWKYFAYCNVNALNLLARSKVSVAINVMC
jgi:hypothetical protein